MPTDQQKFSTGYKGSYSHNARSESEHQGRAPQPGVPTGTRNRPAPEVTAATAPTVTVSPTGKVTTENFGTAADNQAAAEHTARVAAHHAATVAKRKEVQSQRRVAKVRAYVKQRDKELAPRRETKVSSQLERKAVKADLRSPVATDKLVHNTLNAQSVKASKPVAVAEHARKLPGQVKDTPKSVPVAAHERLAPTRQEKQAARKQLRQTRQVVAKTTGLTGPITPDQKVFAEQVGKETGLSPRVVAAQALAEESGSAATGREAEGNNDWLNIGYYDSGPGAITKTPEWANPHTAAKATSEFFKDKKFGPSSSIADIVPSSAGKSDAAQIAAIGDSDWATSGAYRESIEGTHQLIGEKHNPQALQNYKAAVVKAKSLGLKVGKPLGDVVAEPGAKVIKVRADGVGSAKWAESQINTQENSAKQLKWAANEGLAQGAPWCANFASNDLARRGFKQNELPANPNYSGTGGGYETWGEEGRYATNVGTDLSEAKPGDILTFSGEHTAIYAGNGQMISGNFSDEVMKTPVSEGPAPLTMIIQPHYKGGFVKYKETASVPGTINPTGSIAESSAAAVIGAVAGPSPTKSGKQVRQGQRRQQEPKELSYRQKVQQNVRKLKSLGIEARLPGEERAGEGEASASSKSLHSQLAELEKRYKIGAV